MGTLPLSYPPPKNWQDFELLTKEVAKFKLSGDFDNYGRQGQEQKGVDAYGLDHDGNPTGLQCKHKKSAKPTSKKIITTITTEIIDDEIKLADDFTPKLKKFIIATTSFRDKRLQDHIHKLNEDRKTNGLSKIEIWFWETFEEEINRHSELSKIHFDAIVKNSDQYNKDTQILSLLSNALSRPVFNTRFSSENNTDDFLKGISDTQRAFSTGRLYDRAGNLIATSYPAKQLSQEEDRKAILSIEKLLQEIRDFTTDNIANGNIEQIGNHLNIHMDWELGISKRLNDLRGKVVTQLNKVLSKHKLYEIRNSMS